MNKTGQKHSKKLLHAFQIIALKYHLIQHKIFSTKISGVPTYTENWIQNIE
jgi:hypothetical protein